MKTPYTDSIKVNINTTHVQILTACQIALRYTHRLPTWQELVNDFGMSRATAYRWLSAMRAARGQN